MAYCPKCGVSVEKDQVPCPLCFTYIPKIVSDEELLDENGFPTYYSLYENLVNFFIRVVYRVLCVLMILGFLIPTLIDVILNKALTWSLYSNLSILITWSFLYVAFDYVKGKRDKIIVILITICVGLLGFDLINGYAGWSVETAFPLLVITLILIQINIAIFKRNRSWFRQSGYIIFSILLLLIGIELIVGRYSNTDNIVFHSVDELLPSTLLGAILLLISYRMPKKWVEKLKRKFHI
ncbi:DUF6320 domain-containing protein [Terribacillus saccharophilus]|uniref:Zinc ribbon domain-containing protein n=1 Tax=Terribacillus saccharophilus TaxID=361277 RepID=A0AAX2EFW5_9BACI|nr:hypothetical protein SAMN04489762_2071 [Terribacillus saccharophilus]